MACIKEEQKLLKNVEVYLEIAEERWKLERIVSPTSERKSILVLFVIHHLHSNVVGSEAKRLILSYLLHRSCFSNPTTAQLTSELLVRCS